MEGGQKMGCFLAVPMLWSGEWSFSGQQLDLFVR